MFLNSRPMSLFYRTKILENKIDLFHDLVAEAALTFKKIISVYLESGNNEDFDRLNHQLKRLEKEADKIRREVETRLYEQNLIPDLRADVLMLVENLDSLLNTFDENGYRFYIERPDIPKEYHPRFKDLVSAVAECVESATLASRAFFRDFSAVRDHSHKVMFYETEADKVAAKLKMDIFNSDLPLANKVHIRYFVDSIDIIADKAEDIVDQLAIYVIKRDI